MPLAALADSNVTFTNADGIFKSSNGQTVLNLSGSALTDVSNLMAPYDCSSPVCSGTVSLSTGTITSPPGSLTTGMATFGSGGSFNVNSTGAGGGFTFAGTFSSETWTKNGSGPSVFWVFVGNIQSGTLTLGNGMVFHNINAGTIDLTTVGGHATPVGSELKWTDSQGTTNFPSPVPEPSTLALFGSGLIAVGMLTKHRLSAAE